MSYTPDELKRLLRARNVKALQLLHDYLDKNYRDENGKLTYGYARHTSKAFGISPNNLRAILDEHPISPRRAVKGKTQPAYITEFEESGAVKKIRATKSKKRANSIISTGRQAWLILGRKDPLTWDYEDFQTLWRHEKLFDTQTGKIQFNKAVALRAFMEVNKLYDLKNSEEFNTKGLKRRKGAKLTHWIQTEQEFIAIINAIKNPDTLMMFNLGIQCGARFSSLRLVKPSDIQYTSNSLRMIEPKLQSRGKELVERFFIKETMNNLRYFIQYFNFKFDERIFKRSLKRINEDLKQAGKQAGIPFDLTTHVAMKHTFVSFASNHGVSLEVVSKQAHTDAGTLMDFYAGIGSAKIGFELLGETEKRAPDFAPVMRALQPIIAKRFEVIKDTQTPKKGKAAKTRPKGKKKRKLNWAAIKGMANSTKTPAHLQATWKKAYALHQAGKTDTEVRKEMGWK